MDFLGKLSDLLTGSTQNMDNYIASVNFYNTLNKLKKDAAYKISYFDFSYSEIISMKKHLSKEELDYDDLKKSNFIPDSENDYPKSLLDMELRFSVKNNINILNILAPNASRLSIYKTYDGISLFRYMHSNFKYGYITRAGHNFKHTNVKEFLDKRYDLIKSLKLEFFVVYEILVDMFIFHNEEFNLSKFNIFDPFIPVDMLTCSDENQPWIIKSFYFKTYDFPYKWKKNDLIKLAKELNTNLNIIYKSSGLSDADKDKEIHNLTLEKIINFIY